MLKERVRRIVDDESRRYDGGVSEFVSDVRTYGCDSGAVASLLRHDYAVDFYETCKHEINDMLAVAMESAGAKSPAEVIDGWDASDPLALDTVNRVLLAWLAFEHTLESIYGND